MKQEREKRTAIRERLAQIRTDVEAAPWWTQTSKHLTESIEAGLKYQWAELRSLEVALAGITEEFDGEDVLRPLLRQDIEEAKQKALEIHTTIQEWTGPFELPDADTEAVRETKELIEVWARNR